MAVVGGLVSAGVVWLVVRHAARLGLVQAPNARSSHAYPTPTGGGIGIVVGAAVGCLLLISTDIGVLSVTAAAALCLAGLGLWDDLKPLPALFRLLAQFVIVGIAVLWLAPRLGWPPPALAAALVVLVGWINLFNFMDGIDGLAGSEAMFLLLAPALVAAAGGVVTSGPLLWAAVAAAAAVLGFLAFNWQPAKIFMGDVGSVFLGALTGGLALAELAAGWLSPWQMLILFACFLADGVLTLARRAAQGERVWEAHRRHAYQHLSRRYGSHRRVVLGVLALDLVWLLPLAMVAGWSPPAGAVALTVIAYLPLVAIAVIAGAGRPEHA
jgi:Fuc2NAc and GlcNAc transferase